MTPAERIAELEQENARLRAALEKLCRAVAIGPLPTLEALREADELLGPEVST